MYGLMTQKISTKSDIASVVDYFADQNWDTLVFCGYFELRGDLVPSLGACAARRVGQPFRQRGPTDGSIKALPHASNPTLQRTHKPTLGSEEAALHGYDGVVRFCILRCRERARVVPSPLRRQA